MPESDIPKCSTVGEFIVAAQAQKVFAQNDWGYATTDNDGNYYVYSLEEKVTYRGRVLLHAWEAYTRLSCPVTA